MLMIKDGESMKVSAYHVPIFERAGWKKSEEKPKAPKAEAFDNFMNAPVESNEGAVEAPVKKARVSSKK